MRQSPIRVLFICTHNSARSQLAEASSGATAGATSRRSRPGRTRPASIPSRCRCWTSRDRLVQRNEQGPGPDLDQPFDYVVTVCDSAREACPVFPGARHVHWSLDDPSQAAGTDEERLEAFRRTRRAVGARLAPFIAEARATVA